MGLIEKIQALSEEERARIYELILALATEENQFHPQPVPDAAGAVS